MQMWIFYVTKDKVQHLQDAADRAGVAIHKEEVMQSAMLYVDIRI